MKALLDFLTLPLSLPINPIWDFVICAIIGEIAYWVAYSFAGRNASSSAGRSALHWAVRIPLYFILWLILLFSLKGDVLDFIKANWIWVLIVLGSLAVIGVIIIVILHIRHKKKEETKNNISDSNSGD